MISWLYHRAKSIRCHDQIIHESSLLIHHMLTPPPPPHHSSSSSTAPCTLLCSVGGYLTRRDSIQLPRVELFIQEIARREPLYFQQRAIDEKDPGYSAAGYRDHYYKVCQCDDEVMMRRRRRRMMMMVMMLKFCMLCHDSHHHH